MRHFYKSHGKHCYLRSFKTTCPTCGADVLYWECTHGSKIFFEYPPYGKLVKHYCRKYLSTKVKSNKYNVIVKTPNHLFEDSKYNCPICGKVFNNLNNLKDHLMQLGKYDAEHKEFYKDRIKFNEENHFKKIELKKKINNSYNLKFGRVNIKNENKKCS